MPLIATFLVRQATEIRRERRASRSGTLAHVRARTGTLAHTQSTFCYPLIGVRAISIFDIFSGQPAIEAAGQQRGVYQGATGQIGNLADITRRYNEDILRGGFAGARTDLGTGYDTARGDLGQGFAGAQGNLTQGYGAVRNDLGQGFAGAQGNLTQGYGAATGAINQGASGALGYLDQGQQGAAAALAGARNDLTANGGAYAPLSALAGRYGQGAGAYADALGINGADGTSRAQNAFTTGPGYNFMVDQGLDAINRRRNAAGSLTGGNADRDAQLFGQGAAKQEWNSYLDRLSPYNQYELNATSGAAAGNAGINNTLAGLGVTGANLQNTGGQNRAAIASGQGNSLADAANRYYTGQAGLDTAQGGAMADAANRFYGAQAGLSTAQGGSMADLASRFYGSQAGLDTGEAGALSGNMWQGTNPQIAAQMNFAPQTAKTYMDEANASLQGSKNLWQLGMQGATALAGGMGGMGGLGGGSLGLPGGNLGLGGATDPSMWNKTLPANGFNW